MVSQKEYNKDTDTEKKKEDWMNSKWRPMMGWMYMAICLFDFMIAPILWSTVQALFHGGITTQWQPLTLQGAGLFHVAMGAVIGISAYGRTQEKLNGANNGGIQGMMQPNGAPMGTTYIPPGMSPQQMGGMSGGYQPPGQMGGMNNGMGGMSGGYQPPGQMGGMNNGMGGMNNSMGGGFGAPASGGFGGATPTTPVSGGFNTPAQGGFGSGFNSGPGTTPATSLPVTVNVAGKKVVPIGNQPEL